MAELHWFPFYAKDWRTSNAVRAMTPEQRGAYVELLVAAWSDGEDEPSLTADDTALAGLSGLGARWKKAGTIVRAQFVERGGRLYNGKLSEVWADQQKKHQQAVERGVRGGKKKAANGKTKPKPTSAALEETGVVSLAAQLPESLPIKNVEGTVQPVLQQVVQVPPPNGALALEGARTAVGDPIPPSFATDWRARVGRPAPSTVS